MIIKLYSNLQMTYRLRVGEVRPWITRIFDQVNKTGAGEPNGQEN